MEIRCSKSRNSDEKKYCRAAIHLMLEEKFAAGHEGPEKILNNRPPFSGRGLSKDHLKSICFLGGRHAGKTEEVSLFNKVGIILFNQRFYAAFVITQVIVKGLAVGEMEHLHHAGFIGTFTFAGNFAFIAAKGFEKVRGYCRVKELKCPGAVLVKISLGRTAIEEGDIGKLGVHLSD